MVHTEADIQHMRQALVCAGQAALIGEVPVGAVVVVGGQVIAQGYNQTRTNCDPSAHAEVVVLRKAAEVCENYRLTAATLYVTLEPCVMCVGALSQARVKRVVFAAADPKLGALWSSCQLRQARCLNHHFEITGGVLAAQSRSLLQDFFRVRRS